MANKKANLAINTMFYIVIAVVSIGVFILLIYDLYPSFAKQLYCSTFDKVSMLSTNQRSPMCIYPNAISSIIIMPNNTTEINATASGRQIIDIPQYPKTKTINITVYGKNSLASAKIIINNTNPNLALLTIAPQFGSTKTFNVNPQSSHEKNQYFDLTNMISEATYNSCTKFPCNITLNLTSQKRPLGSLTSDLSMKLNLSENNCLILDSVAAALIDCGKLSDFGLNPKNITCSYLMFSTKCPFQHINKSTINLTIFKYGMNTRFAVGGCSSEKSRICINLSSSLNPEAGILVSYDSSSKQIILS